jgi:hypothetical protein
LARLVLLPVVGGGDSESAEVGGMTRDEIMVLVDKALDVAVARHIFGHQVIWSEYNQEPIRLLDTEGKGAVGELPMYSLCMEDAWPVFLRMCAEWPDCNFFYLGNKAKDKKFGLSWGFDGHGWDAITGDVSDAATIICRAALCARFDV